MQVSIVVMKRQTGYAAPMPMDVSMVEVPAPANPLGVLIWPLEHSPVITAHILRERGSWRIPAV
jgi:hypothetical protein